MSGVEPEIASERAWRRIRADILSGALAPLVPVQPGDEVSLTLSGLGAARLRFVP